MCHMALMHEERERERERESESMGNTMMGWKHTTIHPPRSVAHSIVCALNVHPSTYDCQRAHPSTLSAAHSSARAQQRTYPPALTSTLQFPRKNLGPS
ncbi:hypothetical protein AMTRI_Chr13g120840 [Amborella trichopoda]